MLIAVNWIYGSSNAYYGGAAGAFTRISEGLSSRQDLNSSCSLCHCSGRSGPVQIIGRLQAHPKLWRSPKRIREVQGRIGCNAPLASNQFVESGPGPTNFPRECSLAHALGLEKLFQQHFAWVKRIFRFSVHGLHLPVTVHYLYIV